MEDLEGNQPVTQDRDTITVRKDGSDPPMLNCGIQLLGSLWGLWLLSANVRSHFDGCG